MKTMKLPHVIRKAAIAICCAAFISPALAQDKSDLTDEEVASVAVVANQIDIRAAELAKKQSRNDKVLSFAGTMISDHQAVIDQASALVKKLGVTPKENAVGQGLLDNAAKVEERLKSLSGSAFDKAYVDNEVSYHEAVIGAIKNLLIPQAENAELKELLTGVLPAFDAHLGHAKMLQKELNGKQH